MPIFKTDKLDIKACTDGNYKVTLPKQKPIFVDVEGTWRSRPKGRRLFSDAEIRQIRSAQGTVREIANTFNCSHVSIYHIRKRSIYCDVI